MKKGKTEWKKSLKGKSPSKTIDVWTSSEDKEVNNEKFHYIILPSPEGHLEKASPPRGPLRERSKGFWSSIERMEVSQ